MELTISYWLCKRPKEGAPSSVCSSTCSSPRTPRSYVHSAIKFVSFSVNTTRGVVFGALQKTLTKGVVWAGTLLSPGVEDLDEPGGDDGHTAQGLLYLGLLYCSHLTVVFISRYLWLIYRNTVYHEVRGCKERTDTWLSDNLKNHLHTLTSIRGNRV